jgi:hypothetical protein
MENVGIFYGHLRHITTTLYILWPFGIFCVNLVYIFPFWYVATRKIWQPRPADFWSCRWPQVWAELRFHKNLFHFVQKVFDGRHLDRLTGRHIQAIEI